jgi:hypothetical protein
MEVMTDVLVGWVQMSRTQSSPVGAGRAAVGAFDFREDDYVKSRLAQVV